MNVRGNFGDLFGLGPILIPLSGSLLTSGHIRL